MDYYYIIIILSLLCSALFSGTEIAFISSNKLQIELGKKQGHIADRILSWFNKRKSTFIAAMLVGNNFALVAYAYFMEKKLTPPIEGLWDNLVFVLLAQTFVSSIVVLFVAEFLPKTIFRINPNRTLHFFLIPIVLAYFVLLLPAILISLLSEFIIKTFTKIEKQETETVLGRVDLDNYFSEMELHKSDTSEMENEVQIFQNALDFGKTKARDIMIPRNEVVAMDITDNIERLKENFLSSGLSKILIFKGQIDNIIGYVHNRELFKKPKSIKSILLPLTIIPESKLASDILKQFTRQKQSMAVVVDEYGGTAGILTIEDVVEEIFGEIEDEHDTEQLIERKLSDNAYLFSARHELDTLIEKYNLPITESDEYDTLAGLVLYHSKNIPLKNEKIYLEEVIIEVIEVSVNKIELLKLTIKQ